MMTATTDQMLVPNAITEYHSARDSGLSEADAWTFVVSRIRFDVLRLAIASCTVVAIRDAASPDWQNACAACAHELTELQSSFSDEPASE